MNELKLWRELVVLKIVHLFRNRSKLNSILWDIQCQMRQSKRCWIGRSDRANNVNKSAAAAASYDRKVNHFLTWITIGFELNQLNKEILTRQLIISKRERQCCYMADPLQQIFHKRHNQKFDSCEITWQGIKIWKQPRFSTANYTFIHSPE